MSETKQALAALGLGALLCLPCLAVIAGVSVAVSGAAVLALVRNPVAQSLAALLVIAALVAIWRYVAYRRACAVEPPVRLAHRVSDGMEHGEAK